MAFSLSASSLSSGAPDGGERQGRRLSLGLGGRRASGAGLPPGSPQRRSSNAGLAPGGSQRRSSSAGLAPGGPQVPPSAAAQLTEELPSKPRPGEDAPTRASVVQGRRGSISTKADEAEVPDEVNPLDGARREALERSQTGLAIPDYGGVPEVSESEDSREDEGEGYTGERRASIISLVRDNLFGRDGGVSKKSIAKDRHMRERGTTVFDAGDRTKMANIEGLAAQPRSQLMDDPRLAAGEAAFVMHHNALKAAMCTKPLQRTIGGKQVSPISRGYELVKEKIELEEAHKDGKDLSGSGGVAKHLVEWLEAGLQRTPGGVEGKRVLPAGYEIAVWASAHVPLVRHRQTGVIIWPVRLDLTSLYDEVEGVHKDGFASNTTTVFHYTSTGGFHRIVAPPTYFTDDEEHEAHLVAEEVWDRIEDDIHHHDVPPVEGAPELSLMLVGSEPNRFENREAVNRAVYRSKTNRAAAGRVGHCIALQVPANRCMAVPGKLHVHTVVVMPPVQEEEEEEGEGGGGLKRFGRLVHWKHRHGHKRQHASVAAEVRGMNLLEGIVDRDSGKVTLKVQGPEGSSPGSTARRRHMDAADSSGRQKASPTGIHESARDSPTTPQSLAKDDEDPEVELQMKLAQLHKEHDLLERKIKHAERSQGKLEAGEQVKFLATDGHRLESLQRRLDKCKLQVKQVQRELELYTEGAEDEAHGHLTSVAEEPDEGGDGENDDGEASNQRVAQTAAVSRKTARKALAIKRRRRKAQANQVTHFSGDVQDGINDVGDEYQLQSGDIFREVFGGNMEGVRTWLEDDTNDLNTFHPSIGWTPLHMAVSMGDPQMVSMILKAGGDPEQPTREEGWCPVHFAVWKNSVELLKMLLKKDDDCVKHKTKAGETPLFISIKSSSARIRDEMVRELLKAHADPNTKQNEEWTPLALAVVRNYQSEVRQLVQNRGNVFEECPDDPGKTIWQASARHPGLQEIIRGKLNSRDLHIVEKRWPGSLKGTAAKD